MRDIRFRMRYTLGKEQPKRQTLDEQLERENAIAKLSKDYPEDIIKDALWRIDHDWDANCCNNDWEQKEGKVKEVMDIIRTRQGEPKKKEK